MRLNIKATNIKLTPAISGYLEGKLGGLRRFVPAGEDAAKINVELGRATRHHRQGEIFRAEINANIGGQQYYAVGEGQDLYVAVDEMKDEILHEIKGARKKQNTLLRRGGRILKNLLRSWRSWR